MEHQEYRDQEAAAATSGSASDPEIQFPTSPDGYKLVSPIGIGDHGTVYLAMFKSGVDSTTMVAIKIIDIDVEIDPISITNMKTLSVVNYPNILSPHCSFPGDDGRLWIVMPFIQAGSLQSIVSNRFPSGFPDQFLAILLNQLLRAMVSLHEMGLVHKAIKPSNIFFDSDGSVKISDLDISKTNSTHDRIRDPSSVPYWVPPEEEFSFKSDVWSLGIVAMEMAYGGPPISDSRILNAQSLNILRRFPYESNNNEDNNVEKKPGKSNVLERKFGDSLKDFVRSCLVKDRFARPSASSLLNHPFVMKGESSNFLFKSIAKGMVPIGDRFEQEKDKITGLMKNDEVKVVVGNTSQVEKTLKITGWDYNNFLFEMEPDEASLGKRVRFCGETIISYRQDDDEDAEEDQSKTDMPSLLERIVGSSSRASGGNGSEKIKAEEVMDDENLTNVLSSLLEGIDQQKEMVMILINHFDNWNKKELEMKKEIKRLETELASEKEKSFQLELDYEVLKLKIPDSEEEDENQDENQEENQEENQDSEGNN